MLRNQSKSRKPHDENESKKSNQNLIKSKIKFK